MTTYGIAATDGTGDHGGFTRLDAARAAAQTMADARGCSVEIYDASAASGEGERPTVETVEPTTQTMEVELQSAVGPRVLVTDDDADDDDDDTAGDRAYARKEWILANLPSGWTVHEDDWGNGVRTDSGRMSYPLSRRDRDNA
jgi:hypothetical protein